MPDATISMAIGDDPLHPSNSLFLRKRGRRGRKNGGVAGGEAARHTPYKNPLSLWGLRA